MLSPLRSAVVFAAVLMLTSCATPRYQQPQSGTTAVLRLLPVGKTNAFSYQRASICTGRQMVISTKDPEGAPKVITIPAQEAFTLTLAWDTHASFSNSAIEFKGCAPTVTFVPEAGRKYVAGPSTDGQCALYLRDDAGTAVQATQRRWKTGLSESSSFCD